MAVELLVKDNAAVIFRAPPRSIAAPLVSAFLSRSCPLTPPCLCPLFLGEKPFSCPHCSRAFADRSNLRAHLQTHSDIKKYQCKGCSKTFSRISLLSKHEEAGCCPLS